MRKSLTNSQAMQQLAKMKPKISQALRATAYHEAGHAVMCIYLQRKFRYLTIVSEGTAAGHLARFASKPVQGRQLWFERVPHWIDVILMISVAGEIAQHRGCPRSVKHVHGSSDRSHMHDYLFGLNVPGWQYYFEYCRARSKATFNDKITWAGVEALVKALIQRQTISYEDAVKIFRDATDKEVQKGTRNILRSV
jgi:hypothetical protein